MKNLIGNYLASNRKLGIHGSMQSGKENTRNKNAHQSAMWNHGTE